MSVFNRNEKAWTNRDVDAMRKLWDIGCTAGDIAVVLGRTRNSICSAARRYGMSKRTSPIPNKPNLVTLRQQELARQAAIEELMKI